MPANEICYLTATELTRHIRSKKLFSGGFGIRPYWSFWQPSPDSCQKLYT